MFRKLLSGFLLMILVATAYAQAPDHYPPTVPQPVDITLFNLILYIVLPIGLVVAFFWYQRSQKKKRNKIRMEQEKNENQRNK